MIKKFTVVWLLSLFVWNVALAGVPSLLLCLHDDFKVHVESESAESEHCGDGHCSDGSVDSQELESCVVADDCTDLELQGSKLIPTRVNDLEDLELPLFSAIELIFSVPMVPIERTNTKLLPPSRAPPSVHWLTEIYIQKTVLRV